MKIWFDTSLADNKLAYQQTNVNKKSKKKQ